MEIHIVSPFVKIVRNEEYQTTRSLPVFNGGDRISGYVVLDSNSYQSGRFSISVSTFIQIFPALTDCNRQIEGTFLYISPQEAEEEDMSQDPNNRRHVFFQSTTVIPVESDITSARTPTFLRDAFSTHYQKKPSISSLRSVKNSVKESLPPRFPFSFEVPLGRQPGQELPPTFSASTLVRSGTRGRIFVEKTEIAYKVTALWEPNDEYDSRVP